MLLGLAPTSGSPSTTTVGPSADAGSTFFLVPFKGRPGVGPDGAVDVRRATPYGIRDITREASKAADGGDEIAVHGIDAWRDASAGREEMSELTRSLGRRPARHQDALAVFRVGLSSTARSRRLRLRLDLGIQRRRRLSGRERLRCFSLPAPGPAGAAVVDHGFGVLFPDRMGLSQQDAIKLCRPIVANARRLGGTVVVNWHDRSLAPERLWNRCYQPTVDGNRTRDRFGLPRPERRSIGSDGAASVRFVANGGPGRLKVVPPSTPQAGPAAASGFIAAQGLPMFRSMEANCDGGDMRKSLGGTFWRSRQAPRRIAECTRRGHGRQGSRLHDRLHRLLYRCACSPRSRNAGLKRIQGPMPDNQRWTHPASFVLDGVEVRELAMSRNTAARARALILRRTFVSCWPPLWRASGC